VSGAASSSRLARPKSVILGVTPSPPQPPSPTKGEGGEKDSVLLPSPHSGGGAGGGGNESRMLPGLRSRGTMPGGRAGAWARAAPPAGGAGTRRRGPPPPRGGRGGGPRARARAPHVLHRQEGQPPRLADLVHLDHVRVPQPGGGLGLPPEAAALL